MKILVIGGAGLVGVMVVEELVKRGADVRMMQGYLERGFTAEVGDLETLTALIGHPPRRYEDFARETAGKWAKDLPWPLEKLAGKL